MQSVCQSLLSETWTASSLSFYKRTPSLTEVIAAFHLSAKYYREDEGRSASTKQAIKEFKAYEKIAIDYLTNLFNCPEELDKTMSFLREKFKDIRLQRLMKQNTTCWSCADLANDSAVISNVNYFKKHAPRGAIMDMFEIVPQEYFKDFPCGHFVKSRTASALRNLFNWTPKLVPCLTTIGFEYENRSRFHLILEDTDTGDKFRTNTQEYSGQKEFNFSDDIFPTEGRKKYRFVYSLILGANRQKHSEAVKRISAEAIANISKGHSVKHKEHKESKVYENATVYLDKDGNETTANEYAKKTGFTRQYAHKLLKKLQGEVK